MTVEELRDELSRYPPTAQVLICHDDADGGPIEVDIASIVYEFGEVSIIVEKDDEA